MKRSRTCAERAAVQLGCGGRLIEGPLRAGTQLPAACDDLTG